MVEEGLQEPNTVKLTSVVSAFGWLFTVQKPRLKP